MIGIVAAMEVEAAPFLRAGKAVGETVFGKTFYKIEELDAVVAVSGIGKVNASFATAILISRYNPDIILNCGVSGGLGGDCRTEILDVVVATSCVQHDVDTSPLGDPKGLVSTVNMIYFPTDGVLNEKILADSGAKCGVVACGEQFVASQGKKDEIVKEFNAIACDMESGAVAQCAYLAGKRFVCVRCISDGGDGRAPADYGKFCIAAAEKMFLAVKPLFE